MNSKINIPVKMQVDAGVMYERFLKIIERTEDVMQKVDFSINEELQMLRNKGKQVAESMTVQLKKMIKGSIDLNLTLSDLESFTGVFDKYIDQQEKLIDDYLDLMNKFCGK
ncbi:YlbF/YmcA family competence regulator [Paenibacillus polymyxa]|uniref:hypothetical protein n=1 Tax=Paenibacillus polymyxa TaxID=1406 RepID=UPI0008FB6F9D|nr:hypothetical protein [Paenibacillus polymyxa]APB76440.1 YlbF/YmcA family competence regulator [Paenibacillus polymyxa]